mgnify:CR=1 FL=1
MRFALILAAAAALAAAGPASAEFQKITDRAQFEQLVAGTPLTRLGIELSVTPSGDITGSAFGQPVRGQWTWEGSYFCRDLAWGDTDFGYNCQEVARNGNALRFTSDRGAGRSAKLYLD